MSESDRELLERSAAGDAGAFEAFVARHQASVYRYLRALTGDDADAEDALQETFLAAWRGAAGFRGADSARAWILTIARNAARRQHRRRAGEPERFESVDSVDWLGLMAGWGSEPAPDELLARLADRDLLARAMARLSEEDREILVLRDLEGFSGEEVTRMTGLTLPAAKSRLHRARLRLTAALKEEVHADA